MSAMNINQDHDFMEEFIQVYADAIPQTIGHIRADLKHSVISFHPWTHNAVFNSLSCSIDCRTTSSIGALEKLPIELLQDTMLRLDVATVIKLSQTSRWARTVLDALPAFHNMAKHGIDALCALLRSGLGPTVTLEEFYQALCTRNCTLCGSCFAGFVTLMPFTRCCYNCIMDQPEVGLVGAYALKGIISSASYAAVNSLPTFYSFEGYYGSVPMLHMAQPLVKFTDAARLAAKEVNNRVHRLFRNMGLMGAVAMPWYNQEIDEAEQGLGCAGCKNAADNNNFMMSENLWNHAFLGRDRLYTKEDLVQHFKTCEAAHELWIARRETPDGDLYMTQ